MRRAGRSARQFAGDIRGQLRVHDAQYLAVVLLTGALLQRLSRHQVQPGQLEQHSK